MTTTSWPDLNSTTAPGIEVSGVAVAAQVEAVRAGRPDPLLADSDDDGIPDGQAHARPG